VKRVFAILFLLGLLVARCRAQTLGDGKVWRYKLLEGSSVVDDCLICGRPTIWIPIRGSFDLVGTGNPQIFQITNLVFTSDYSAKPEWRITGAGTINIGNGDPALTADVTIQRLDTIEKLHFTNAPPESVRIFPMLSLLGKESPASLLREYSLRLFAAPIREVWFSTTEPVGGWGPGDLLATDDVRIVKLNSELTEKLALVEPADLSLDAVDVGPRGEIFFSTRTNWESFVNGAIGHGDLVTSGGRVYLQNAQLLAAFGVDDPEAGLDAVHVVSEDEVYFSISKNVTRSNGAKLSRGDILSNKGRIVRTEAALMLRYQNPLRNAVGVDAIYFWPNGEIWFSTENSFTNGFGVFGHGDILSDQGYVALRNADLTLKDSSLPSAGLDSITIISDVTASAAAGQIVEFNLAPGGMDLRWESLGRVFRLEKASAVEGPWLPLTEITVERSVRDAVLGGAAFYRVRQW
jgi:hypothetical protein